MTEITITIPTWAAATIVIMLFVGAGLNVAQAYLTRQLTKLKREIAEQDGYRLN